MELDSPLQPQRPPSCEKINDENANYKALLKKNLHPKRRKTKTYTTLPYFENPLQEIFLPNKSKKVMRKISQNPFKVLDAPFL